MTKREEAQKLLDEAQKLLDEALKLKQKAYRILNEYHEDDTTTEILDRSAVKALAVKTYQTGSILMNSYRVCSTLGTHVYVAKDLNNEGRNRKHIIKVANKNNREWIERGYNTALELEDVAGFPKAEDLVEFGEHIFAIYEYIPGESLANMDPENIEETMLQLCDLLEILHNRGYIHRDIKPSNVIMGMDGKVYLIDLDTVLKTDKKGIGFVDTAVGTPNYSPVELFLKGNEITFASDIYALGKIYKELVSKSQKSAKVIRKATMPNPEDRYETVQEMKEAIQALEN